MVHELSTLILQRHAKSAWPAVPDHDRPLARRGQRDAPVMGRWLRASGYAPDHVLCSTARRAQETWQLVSQGLAVTAAVDMDHRLYHASAAEVLDIIRAERETSRALLVIGHDPAIATLALMLASPSAATDISLSRIAVKFPTSAIAVLRQEGPWNRVRPGSMTFTAFVTPRELSGN